MAAAMETAVLRLVDDPEVPPIFCIFVGEESYDVLQCATGLVQEVVGATVTKQEGTHMKLMAALNDLGPPWEKEPFQIVGITDGPHAGLQAVAVLNWGAAWKKRKQSTDLSISVAVQALKKTPVPDPCGTGLFSSLVDQAQVLDGYFTGHGGSVSVTASKPETLSFGVIGDSLLAAKRDSAKKKKFSNFKEEFQVEFEKTFGTSVIDYTVCTDAGIAEISTSLLGGSSFDVLCVGLGFNDLMDKKNEVLQNYPMTLDMNLKKLANAIKRRANRAIVLVGGPASIWGYPEVWDSHMERASGVLEAAGIQVIPSESALVVMQQLELARDGLHFSGDNKESSMLFAQSWAGWLLEYVDITSFYADKVENTDKAIADRSRSRSPKR